MRLSVAVTRRMVVGAMVAALWAPSLLPAAGAATATSLLLPQSTAFSMLGALAGGVVCGLYSDRLGRRRTIVVALICAIVVIPMWAFAPSVPLLVAGAFVMQFFVQGAWGVIPAHISELSPDGVRGFLPGFAYQCGVLVAGVAPWIQAVFAKRFDYAGTMAFTAVSVFLVGALVVSLGNERRGLVFAG